MGDCKIMRVQGLCECTTTRPTQTTQTTQPPHLHPSSTTQTTPLHASTPSHFHNDTPTYPHINKGNVKQKSKEQRACKGWGNMQYRYYFPVPLNSIQDIEMLFDPVQNHRQLDLMRFHSIGFYSNRLDLVRVTRTYTYVRMLYSVYMDRYKIGMA